MANTLEHIGEIVRRAIGSKKNIEIPQSALLQNLVTSSLQFVIILAEIERIFDVAVPDEYLDPTKLPDIGSIALLVDKLRSAAN